MIDDFIRARLKYQKKVLNQGEKDAIVERYRDEERLRELENGRKSERLSKRK